jgi:hypothetical protein
VVFLLEAVLSAINFQFFIVCPLENLPKPT